MRGSEATVPALPSAPVGWAPYALEFLGGDGRPCREPLTECAQVPFESAVAVRSFPSFRGQRNWPGLWWSATMGRHVGYESWLERDHAMFLDFDAAVAAFAAQPFWLDSYAVAAGKCPKCGWIDESYKLVEMPAPSDEDRAAALQTPCEPSSDISTFITPDDY